MNFSGVSKTEDVFGSSKKFKFLLTLVQCFYTGSEEVATVSVKISNNGFEGVKTYFGKF